MKSQAHEQLIDEIVKIVTGYPQHDWKDELRALMRNRDVQSITEQTWPGDLSHIATGGADHLSEQIEPRKRVRAESRKVVPVTKASPNDIERGLGSIGYDPFDPQ